MGTIEQNALKLAYIVSKYPKHNLSQILSLMQLPGIDVNCAVWQAEDMGWLKVPDKDEPIEIVTLPNFFFDDEVYDLMENLTFTFRHLANKKQDPNEYFLNQWVGGYPSHDFLIAMQELTDSKTIASYTITDPKDGTYTFYTLSENLGKDWGKSQFKDQKKLIVRHNQ